MPPITKKDRLIQDLIGQIRSGALPPGSKLPSAKNLRESYVVSQMTVRSAIEHLKTAGYVETVAGLGVYVVESPPT